MPDHIFNTIVIPEAPVTAGKLRFSICFELNTRHPVLGVPMTGDVTTWKAQVGKFYEQINGLLSNAYFTIFSEGRTTTAGPLKDFLVDAFANPKYDRVRIGLWSAFTGFPVGLANKSSVFEPLPKMAADKMFQLQVESFSQPEMSESYLLEPAQKGFGNPASGSLQTDFNLKAFADHITTNILGGNDEKIKRIRDGIWKASEVFRIKIGQRNQKIVLQAENSQFGSSILQSFMVDVRANLEQALAKMQISREEKNELDGLLKSYGSFHALLIAVNNEPPMIEKALDQINNTTFLRKFMKTMLTLELAEALVPTADFSITLTDVRGPQTYFDFALTTKCQCSPYNGRVIPALHPNDVIHDAGFLKVGTNCEIKNYEPEAVLMNAAAAMREYNEKDSDVQAEVLELGKYTNPTFRKMAANPVTMQERKNNQEQLLEISRYKAALDAGRALHNQVNNTETKGQALYLKNALTATFTADSNLFLGDLVMGYAVFGRKKGTTQWTSLTEVKEDFTFSDKSLAPASSDSELGVNIDVGMHSTTDANGVPNANGSVSMLKSNFVFLWDGTKVGSMNPMQQYENGKPLAVDSMEELEENRDDVQPEILAIENRIRNKFAIEWFPFKKRPREKMPDITLKRGFYNKPQLKLKFGDAYEYVLAVQLKNGYVFLKDLILAATPASAIVTKIDACKTIPEAEPAFLRHQHIKDCIISLKANIYENDTSSRVLKKFAGESHTDLVVRTGELINNNESSRYILPPPIPSFQVYLWYKREGKLAKRQLSPNDSASWFLRYQCELEDESHFERNQEDCVDSDNCSGCRAGCASYCKGNKQPRVYGGALNYLPDPIVTGFIVKLFADPERRIELTTEDAGTYQQPYCEFEGSYPQWQPWEIILKKDPKEGSLDPKIGVSKAARKLTIFIEKGKRLYADVIPVFMKDANGFFPASLPADMYAASVDNSNAVCNTLFSNITRLTLTHACQRPVVTPTFKGEETILHRYFREADQSKMPLKEESFRAIMNLQFEHVNLHAGVPIAGLVPTGELELYGLWDDYSESKALPHKSIADKRAGGFLRLGSVRFGDYSNSIENLSFVGKNDDNPITFTAEKVSFIANPEFYIPHHSDLVLKVRNTSQFGRFFKTGEVSEQEKEQFTVWSSEVVLSNAGKLVAADSESSQANFLFNNKKIPAPRIAKIIPLKITDTSSTLIVERMNWMRFYFEPHGMNFSGKGQRVAAVLGNKENRAHLYKNYFSGNNFISQGGTDIVTVNPTDNLGQAIITRDNIVLDDHSSKFDARYEAAITPVEQLPLELVSYVPAYDEEQDLWYVDVGLDLTSAGKVVHTVFAQLNFVYYQPSAANYNVVNTPAGPTIEDSKQGFEKDYRFSQPITADFISVYPQRTYRNHYVLLKRNTAESFVFAPEVSSLYFKDAKLLTQFFVFVQRRDAFWTTIDCDYKTVSGTKTADYHPILPNDLKPDSPSAEYRFNLDWKGNGEHRVMIMEIDYINEGKGLDVLMGLLAKVPQAMVSDLPGVWVRNILEISSRKLV